MLFRYPETREVTTALDPLADLLSWIRTLTSTSYCEEVLATTHGMRSRTDIGAASKSIASHVSQASRLLEEGLSSRPETAYLPLYYGLLNLAKALIVANGRLHELKTQRTHGANWSGISTNVHDLRNDHITLMERGAISLFYQVVHGTLWPKSAQRTRNQQYISTHKRKIHMRDVYPYIPSVGHEFSHAYGGELRLAGVIAETVGPPTGPFQVSLRFPGPFRPTQATRRTYPILKGFSLQGGTWKSRPFAAASAPDADRECGRHFRRHLLYTLLTYTQIQGRAGLVLLPHTLTPISTVNIIMPSEFSVLLAFFHLGSVARYDPERLNRLLDSKAAPIIEKGYPFKCGRHKM